MPYPHKLLTDGEHIEREMRPHWRILVIPVLVLFVVVFASMYSLSRWGDGKPWLDWMIVIAFVVVLMLWVVAPFLRWATSQYVLTNRRIIVRSGVVARQGRDMPLARVNDVHFRYTVLERLLGCGTLIVESAGESGQLVIAAVPHVELVQREVFRLHEVDDERRRRDGRSMD
ncbi:MAG: PH domain-containing protein [Actinomycetes bacterium]